ncbi:translation initiation factor IF-2 subunit gamma [Candidatus Woesearchaeota archaeon]|nr:translation initiation factor IF-2 subunit gamma [Candidatus Woesearchaeota archaeon]
MTQSLSGRWTDTHSEEIKRGITIRLGYADADFYYCEKCKEYGVKEKCSKCNGKTKFLRKVSFIDAPGHETLMAVMLSGAAIMDGALLLVAANEECPQPQTREHLTALSIIGVKSIVVVQNKIDLVTKEQAVENYKQIKKFLKGTIAEDAPIIPISAQHNINIDKIIEAVEDVIKTPKRNDMLDPLMFLARSFDINKPGTDVDSLVGGVLGGSLKQGKLKIDDVIEIKPGLKTEKEGKILWIPVVTKIIGLKTGGESITEVHPGGSIGVLTELDPSIVKSDNLAGEVTGLKDKLPAIWHEFFLSPNLLERIVGAKDNLVVEPIKINENLMLNVNSSATVGIVTTAKKDLIHVKLKIPVCCNQEDRVTISRIVGARWRLIGYGSIVKK